MTTGQSRDFGEKELQRLGYETVAGGTIGTSMPVDFRNQTALASTVNMSAEADTKAQQQPRESLPAERGTAAQIALYQVGLSS